MRRWVRVEECGRGEVVGGGEEVEMCGGKGVKWWASRRGEDV